MLAKDIFFRRHTIAAIALVRKNVAKLTASSRIIFSELQSLNSLKQNSEQV